MNILFVVHNYIGNSPTYGGTELHVRDVVEQFHNETDCHIWLLYPQDSMTIQVYVLVDTKTGAKEQFEVNHPITWETYQHEEFNRQVSALLQKYQIDLVQFFHLIRFPLNFPLVAKQAGARVVISFFDYYLVCQKFNLLTNDDSRFCGHPNVCLATCDLCLRRSYGYAPGTQQNRRQLVSEILYHADAVHYLCNDVKERFIREYPHLESKQELVMGLGLKDSFIQLATAARQQNIEAKSKTKEEPTFGQKKTLRVAFIGNFARQKGADLLLSVIEHYRGVTAAAKASGQVPPVHFEIFGTPQSPYDTHIDYFAQADVVSVHGKYEPEDLPKLLSDCDVALFASIWPETFVLVLSEEWACGIVPIAPDLGAFGERITDHVTGRHFEIVNDPGSLIEVINEIAESPESLETMRQAINAIVPLTVEDNIQAYKALYRNLLEADAGIAPAVAALYLPEREPHWHYVLTVSGTGATPPAPTSRRQLLLRRAWVVYKQRGLRYTIWATLNYQKIKRG